ncbi:carbohydrate sulfotransferase 14-like isoform X1 [Palaemon carinicauda]|uniref:carbohydrate sulfotransferase 14-like isoform X1 n=1 Tax=Palaemon carinicauda TaxID=392227 RepID=UPI0035B65AB6
MSLLRRVIQPYTSCCVFIALIIILLGLFVNYENIGKSSSEFSKNEKHENMTIDQSEGVVGSSITEEKKEENAVAYRLRARKEKVLEVCRSKNIPCQIKTGLERRIFYFHRYNTSVCTLAKSASSTWRTHLRRVNKGPPLKENIRKDKVRAAFLQRPVEAVLSDVKSFSKIITVRHPLTRLVSAFRNVYNNGRLMNQYRHSAEVKEHERRDGMYWHDRFHRFWIPALLANNMVPPDTHLKVGLKAPIDPTVLYSTEVYEKLHHVLKPKVTFVLFLKFALKTYEEGTADDHWKPYYEDCCPCYFDYDYITKVETLSEDLEYVFKKLGIPSNPQISKNQIRKSVDEINAGFEYYRQVPTTLRRQIYQYLQYDMDLFGYELPDSFLI